MKVPVEEARSTAEDKGLSLIIDIPHRLPPAYGSMARLQQVLTNLLGNAIKFTPPGGTVSLTLAEGYDGIKVEVADTGIGIPADELPHIFDDFYRGSNVKTPGTGLGLSIVNRILSAHGGQIGAESPCTESGMGSKFTFTLPTGKREGREKL
jgi:signal transduction histidine kinase